jgi:hypothetical protein
MYGTEKFPGNEKAFSLFLCQIFHSQIHAGLKKRKVIWAKAFYIHKCTSFSKRMENPSDEPNSNSDDCMDGGEGVGVGGHQLPNPLYPPSDWLACAPQIDVQVVVC